MRTIEIKKESHDKMVDEMPMMRPSFYIETEYLPEAKKWEIGKTYDIKLRLKQTGISMRKNRDGKERGNADFEIVGIEPIGEVKGKKDIKRYEK